MRKYKARQFKLLTKTKPAHIINDTVNMIKAHLISADGIAAEGMVSRPKAP